MSEHTEARVRKLTRAAMRSEIGGEDLRAFIFVRHGMLRINVVFYHFCNAQTARR